MRDLWSLIWCAVVGLVRSRVALQAEILVLRHQLNVLRRKSPKRMALGNIDRVVANRPLSPGTQGAGGNENHYSGNGDPPASHLFSSLLALQILSSQWSAKDIRRDSPARSGDEPRQSVLTHRLELAMMSIIPIHTTGFFQSSRDIRCM
jgi:hypothetical protein